MKQIIINIIIIVIWIASMLLILALPEERELLTSLFCYVMLGTLIYFLFIYKNEENPTKIDDKNLE